MSRGIKLDYVTRYRVDVRGWRARDLIIAATNRRPVWSSVTKSWVITEDSAADLIAICDQRRIEVTTTGAVPKVKWPEVDDDDTHEGDGCNDTAQLGLWGEPWVSAPTRPAS